MKRIVSLVVVLSATVASAQEKKETDTNFDNYGSLAKAVAKADEVVLYEGLPHQAFEKKLLEKELKTKKVVHHNGYPFYAKPLTLKKGDGKKLTDLFTSKGTFVMFGGPKKCGGFHPDYCIEWRVGTDVYRCLVCFGCHEVKVFGPKSELYCDVARVGYKKFKEVLSPYKRNRPGDPAKARP